VHPDQLVPRDRQALPVYRDRQDLSAIRAHQVLLERQAVRELQALWDPLALVERPARLVLPVLQAARDSLELQAHRALQVPLVIRALWEFQGLAVQLDSRD